MTDPSKIKLSHTQRAAYVYIRQSTPGQVEHNRESTARQYALADRACPTASSADLFGRYPYHAGRNNGSTTASKRFFTTICAIRSETVGIPNVLSPPLAFGIFTVRTGGGK